MAKPKQFANMTIEELKTKKDELTETINSLNNDLSEVKTLIIEKENQAKINWFNELQLMIGSKMKLEDVSTEKLAKMLEEVTAKETADKSEPDTGAKNV